MRFCSLASGSSGNCYYIEDSGYGILIDAGISTKNIKKRLKDIDVDINRLWGVLVTHNHYDHVASVGTLGEIYCIPIYSTQKILTGINEHHKITQKLYQNKRPINLGEAFQIGSFTITAFKVEHDTPECVGYYIETANSSLFIATDLGQMNDVAANYLTKAQNIVIEANYDEEMLKQGRYPEMLKERIASGHGHLSNKKTAYALAENFHEKLSYVWLCHLSEENNHPELARKTLESVLRSYGIIAGVDFKLEVLRRKIPTGPFSLT